jgi:lysophospholipase L1-like esterase
VIRFARRLSSAFDCLITFLSAHDGKLNRELFFDPKLTPPASPVHPTAEGQALMAAAIEPTLAALLGDRPHIVAR